MARNEAHPSKNPSDVERDCDVIIQRSDKIRIKHALKTRRIKVLDGEIAILEVRQDGVTRYNPVKVTDKPNFLPVKRRIN